MLLNLLNSCWLPLRWSVLGRFELRSLRKTYPSLRFILLVELVFAFAAWVDAASNPLESFSISAPNCPSADMVHGVGSDSWIHNSWVSMVVKSVSVEAAEWAAWTGVDCFDRVAVNSFFQVHLLSVKVYEENKKWFLFWKFTVLPSAVEDGPPIQPLDQSAVPKFCLCLASRRTVRA